MVSRFPKLNGSGSFSEIPVMLPIQSERKQKMRKREQEKAVLDIAWLVFNGVVFRCQKENEIKKVQNDYAYSQLRSGLSPAKKPTRREQRRKGAQMKEKRTKAR